MSLSYNVIYINHIGYGRAGKIIGGAGLRFSFKTGDAGPKFPYRKWLILEVSF